MENYLIIFQSDKEDVRNRLIERIKRFKLWTKITDCAWLVKSDSNDSVDIRNSLKGLLFNDNGQLIVFNITDSGLASYAIPKVVTSCL